jgi:hypothetical protein
MQEHYSRRWVQNRLSAKRLFGAYWWPPSSWTFGSEDNECFVEFVWILEI